MYTLSELESKTFGELKKIGEELNVLPKGDRRRRQSWIDALVPPPLLQMLEYSPAVSVEQVQEAIEVQAQEQPLESRSTQKAQEYKFFLSLKDGDNTLWYDGQDFVCEKWSAKTYCKRGVGSAKHQLRCHPEVKRVFCSFGNVLQVVTNSPCVEPIEVQAQEPPLESKFGRIVYPQPAQKSIAQAAKTSPAVSVEQVQEAITQAAENIPGVEVDRVQEPIIETVETSPAVSVEQVQEAIEVQAQEPPLESKFGRIVYPQPAQKSIAQAAKTSPANLLEQVQEVIAQAAKNTPGVEVDRAEEPIMETVKTSPANLLEQVQEAIAQATKTSPAVSVEQVQEAIAQAAETFPVENEQAQEWVDPEPPSRLDYEFQEEYDEAFKEWRAATKKIGSTAAKTSPGIEVDRAEEPIMETVKNSPGVDLDDELPECSNCFGDGYVEDEFGSVKFCPCETEPKLSHQRTQRAIAPAAKNSLKPESDLNPILTGIGLSDRFLARYAPPQSGIVHFQSDADGQLSLLNFEIEFASEPPDPDDFKSLDAFREAITRWNLEHPSSSDHCSDLPNSVHSEPNSVHSEPNSVHSESSSVHSNPLEVSLNSFCEWAPCPADWYEPTTLLEPSKVIELSLNPNTSGTSDFFILTFGRWGDRSNGTDEPPDTGIFARLPKPKPPTFPPQAANQTQVSPSQPKSAQVNQTRNYPETIPKLFHCIVAGSSTQPARSPPGGDAMS